MSGEYVTQIVKGKAGWSALLPELEELSASAESFNPYFSPEWLDSWSSHVGIAYNPVLLTVREQDGQLSGFWPFVETPAIFGTGFRLCVDTMPLIIWILLRERLILCCSSPLLKVLVDY